MKSKQKLTNSVATLSNGSVCFVNGRKEQPEKESTQGSLTVRTPAVSATPDMFVVSFNIHATHSLDGAEAESHLMLEVPISTSSSYRDYREVEDEAAHLLPAVLHDIADTLAEEIEHAKKVREEKRTE